MIVLLGVLFIKFAMAGAVVGVAMLLFDVVAFHRTPTPEWFTIIGGSVILLTLIFTTLSAILFIFS